jgi:hypothetical protein
MQINTHFSRLYFCCVASLLLCAELRAQGLDNLYLGERLFLNPVASSSEEAVRLQLVDEEMFLARLDMLLLTLDQPVSMRTGMEIKAARPIGRSLEFFLAFSTDPDEVKDLTFEACNRVPFSGWTENATAVSELAASVWEEMTGISEEKNRKVSKTVDSKFYTFQVNSDFFPTKGSPARIEIVLHTKDFDTYFDRVITELETTKSAFLPTRTRIGEHTKKLKQKYAEQSLEVRQFVDWHCEMIANSDNRLAKLVDFDHRWPAIVRIQFSADPSDWTVIRGERRLTDDTSQLSRWVEHKFRMMTAKAELPVLKDRIQLPKLANEIRLFQHDPVQLSWLRKVEDGVELIELKLRLKAK